MKTKARMLFFKLLDLHHGIPYHLFNMVNEPIEDRFLPIRVYNDKLQWVELILWDNEKEELYRFAEIQKEFSFDPLLILQSYEWVHKELYLYYNQGVDFCVTGLLTGDVVCKNC